MDFLLNPWKLHNRKHSTGFLTSVQTTNITKLSVLFIYKDLICESYYKSNNM